MSFFKKLFKKKPGGTLFGNLLRTGASVASGGVLGQGANMIPLENPQPAQLPVPSIGESPAVQKLNEILKGATKDVTVKGGLDNNTMYLVGGIGVLAILLIALKK